MNKQKKKNKYNRLKDVAEKAGVAVSTVSRVVNNEKYVSEEVKNKVLKAVKELNYEPAWTGRSLRLGVTNIIAVIVPDISNNFFANVVLAIEDYFRLKGKEFVLFDTSNHEDIEEKAIKIALSKRVDGIILATVSKKNFPKKINIPIVIIDNRIDVKNVDFVLHDDINGCYRLTNHLIKTHNITKIAFISGPLNESSGIEKLIGYKKALEENKIPINEKYIKIANWKETEAYNTTEELLNMKDKPEAIFTANTSMAIGSIRYINYHNIKIPDEIAFVTFDDNNYVTAFNPPLTTLERVDTKMGKIASELLNERIKGKTGNYKEVVLNQKLVIRKSCGCNKF